jgi:acyl dehydratase
MSKLYDDLTALVGQESEPKKGAYAVSEAMIRHWCEAMQDGNPLYTDEKLAKKSEYKSIIAPPQMAQTYTMSPLWPKKDEKPDILGQAVKIAADAGYFGVVATNTTQEFFEPMRPGDRIFLKAKLASVSPEKKTRLGKGFFVTADMTYTNQDEKVVCFQPFTVYLFKPEM